MARLAAVSSRTLNVNRPVAFPAGLALAPAEPGTPGAAERAPARAEAGILDDPLELARFTRFSETADGRRFTYADTVGFVRDLPHDLVAAFRSTLSEARDADLLLHVVDAADPLREQRIDQVNAVLEEIGAGDLPQLMVFNKIDRIEGAEPRVDGEPGAPERVWVSARDGLGLDLLGEAMAERCIEQRIRQTVRLSPAAGRLRARLFEAGAVVSETSDDDGWRLQLDLPTAVARQLCAGDDAGSRELQTQLLVTS